MKPGKDGRLYAINPENGFFGVAPGTNEKSNPNALACTRKNTIFTNVAMNNEDNTVWWEKLDKNPPVDATEWKGAKVNGPEYIAEGGNLAHPNSRFTAPLRTAHAFLLSLIILRVYRFPQLSLVVVVHLQLLWYISHLIGHTAHILVLLFLLKQQQLQQVLLAYSVMTQWL